MVIAAEQPVLLSLVGGGFAAAFLHAALPTHWLPFALVSRAQGWTLGRTLACVTTAGLAHIASTALAGALVVAAGLALDHWIEGLLPYLSAALLFLFGATYLIRAATRQPVLAGGPGIEPSKPAGAGPAAFWGLVGVMALSPGEVLLPLYLSAAKGTPATLAALTTAFLLGTIAGMAVFTTAARWGASLLRLERLARYESVVLGLALIAIAALVAFRHGAH